MTDPSSLIPRTETFVRDHMAGDASGHDWHHVDRVRRTALLLAAEEGADPVVVELAALLHDVWDHKLHGGDAAVAPREALRWLTEAGTTRELAEHVAEIIHDLSFKGAGVATPMKTVEGAVVQDADRLDAMGAVGIGRAFAFGGSRGRAMHDPEAAPEHHASFEAYRAAAGSTLNHFPEKLFLLRDRMNTEAGRRVAERRHRFMEEFVETFLAEWSGHDVRAEVR